MLETPDYSIIQTIHDLEIRKYPPMVLIKVTDSNDDNAFGHLFRYITGSNQSRAKISMTTPVITNEKIPMTAPVISNQGEMAFVVPKKYSLDTAPIPIDPKVYLEDIPERIMAVYRFSGYTPEKRVKKLQKDLITELLKNNIRIIGDPILMRYNSPFSLGFMRRNEVAIEVNL